MVGLPAVIGFFAADEVAEVMHAIWAWSQNNAAVIRLSKMDTAAAAKKVARALDKAKGKPAAADDSSMPRSRGGSKNKRERDAGGGANRTSPKMKKHDKGSPRLGLAGPSVS